MRLSAWIVSYSQLCIKKIIASLQYNLKFYKYWVRFTIKNVLIKKIRKKYWSSCNKYTVDLFYSFFRTTKKIFLFFCTRETGLPFTAWRAIYGTFHILGYNSHKWSSISCTYIMLCHIWHKTKCSKCLVHSHPATWVIFTPN